LVPGIFSLAASGAAKTVHIANGTIRGGKCSTTNSNYFFSIPFAQPPVGDLRLKAPVALLNTYNGTLNATTPAPSCIQFNTEFGESSNLSEDW
jgi:para-nitrobenzyl esterase